MVYIELRCVIQYGFWMLLFLVAIGARIEPGILCPHYNAHKIYTYLYYHREETDKSVQSDYNSHLAKAYSALSCSYT